MKAILFIMMLFQSLEGFTQWETVSFDGKGPAPVNFWIMGVVFKDQSNGFICGNPYKISDIINPNGYILGTRDCGMNWDTLLIVDSINFYKIIKVDSTTLFAIGFDDNKNHSVVAKSDNSGQSWKCTFFNDLISSISFPTDSIGYMSSSYGNIYKSINAGNSWVIIHSSIESTYLKIGFFDNLNGIVAGNNILTTKDGGGTWTTPSLFEGQGSYSLGISIISNQKGFLLIDTCLFKSLDSGLSWSLVQHPVPRIKQDMIKSLFFPNDSIGYLTCTQNQYKTFNGGLSWGVLASPLGNIFLGILEDSYFLSADTGFLVGEFGLFYKTFNGGGGIVQKIKNIQDNNSINLYPNPVSRYLTIELRDSRKANFKLYNFKGQLSYEIEIENNIQIDLSNLDNGMYFVIIVTDHSYLSEKIILIKK